MKKGARSRVGGGRQLECAGERRWRGGHNAQSAGSGWSRENFHGKSFMSTRTEALYAHHCWRRKPGSLFSELLCAASVKSSWTITHCANQGALSSKPWKNMVLLSKASGITIITRSSEPE